MKILSSIVAYECPIFVVEERRVEFDDLSQETRWVVVRTANVSVVALTDEKEIVFIRERVGKMEQEVLALPSGKMPSFHPSEHELKKEALWELESEAGYRAVHIELLSVRETPSDYMERPYYRYAAWGLEAVGQQLEKGEKITPVLVSAHAIEEFLAYSGLESKSEVQTVHEAISFFKRQGLLK